MIEIYDHVWPWIGPTSGIPIEPKVKKIQRKNTNAPRYKKTKKEDVRLDKLIRVHEKRTRKLEKIIVRNLKSALWSTIYPKGMC